ncbi:MAG: ABC transporter substrate-binding protein [Candidatus Brocadia sp.]|nr:ABC transporter substrate-binding protein [Candidatus Brocadia sp.]UJS18665.1 MAG: ABC transporter substrate-binding protein [Candidatus Jettenia sp.]
MGICKTMGIVYRALTAFFVVYAIIGRVQAENVQNILLISHHIVPYRDVFAGFQRFLNQQGVKVHYDEYILQDDLVKPKQVIKKVKDKKANIIFALGNKATETILRDIQDIPVVTSMILKKDILINAKNATGVTLAFPLEIEFSLLRQLLPEARRVGVVYHLEENQEKIDLARRIAEKMGIVLYTQEVNSPKDLPNALKNIAKNGDVLWGISDNMVLNAQTAKQILLFSFRNNIPFCGLSPSWVEAGAFYSLGWDYTDIGMQAGEIAWKILQGNEPNSVPIASPRTVRYFLNLKTAKHMKIKIPEEIINKAYQVFKE